MAVASSARRFCILLLVAASGWLLPGCGGEPLQEFQSKEGRFAILLPGTPQTPKDPHLPKMVKVVRLDQRSGTFDVAWEDLDVTDRKLSPEDRLDLACKAAIKKLKGKELSRKTITLADRYPGLELMAESPDGRIILRDRMYLVDGRLYQVLASGARWWVESATVRKVLDSFRLVEE